MITGAEFVAANAATTTIKSLYEVIRDARNSNDPEKLKIAIEAAYERLLTAREQVAALQDERTAALNRANALQKKLESRIDFEEEAQNYELHRFDPGTFAYRKKGVSEHENHIPRYCQPCFSKQELSLLHSTPRLEMRYRIYFCPECKTEFAMSGVSSGVWSS